MKEDLRINSLRRSLSGKAKLCDVTLKGIGTDTIIHVFNQKTTKNEFIDIIAYISDKSSYYVRLQIVLFNTITMEPISFCA